MLARSGEGRVVRLGLAVQRRRTVGRVQADLLPDVIRDLPDRQAQTATVKALAASRPLSRLAARRTSAMVWVTSMYPDCRGTSSPTSIF